MRLSETHLIAERLMTRQQYLELAGDSTIVTPDENLAQAARLKGLRVEVVEHPRSDVIVRLGWCKIRAGQTVSPEDLEANYIRRSDAEIFARSSS